MHAHRPLEAFLAVAEEQKQKGRDVLNLPGQPLLPLGFAVRVGNKEAVQQLLAAGCDPLLQDNMWAPKTLPLCLSVYLSYTRSIGEERGRTHASRASTLMPEGLGLMHAAGATMRCGTPSMPASVAGPSASCCWPTLLSACRPCLTRRDMHVEPVQLLYALSDLRDVERLLRVLASLVDGSWGMPGCCHGRTAGDRDGRLRDGRHGR